MKEHAPSDDPHAPSGAKVEVEEIIILAIQIDSNPNAKLSFNLWHQSFGTM
jgi:hypothetical protein